MLGGRRERVVVVFARAESNGRGARAARGSVGQGRSREELGGSADDSGGDGRGAGGLMLQRRAGQRTGRDGGGPGQRRIAAVAVGRGRGRG